MCDHKTSDLPPQMTNLNAVIPHSNAFNHFSVEKNVLFAQRDKCCELRKTKCQPMRSAVT